MKKILLIMLVFFTLISCGDIGGTNNGNSEGSNGGIGFNPPFSNGDILEKPIREVVAVESITGSSIGAQFNFEETKAEDGVKGISLRISLNPPLQEASMFEIMTQYHNGFGISTDCYSMLYKGKCFLDVKFAPTCNGKYRNLVSFSADKAAAKTIDFIGEGVGFIDNCTDTSIKDVVMKSNISGMKNMQIGQIAYFTVKADKNIPKGNSYSRSGSINGFYYAYNCFLNGSNECTGQIQFTGKIGGKFCFGVGDYELKIHADPANTKNNIEAVLKFSGVGNGLGTPVDKNYPCNMK